ALIFGGTRTIFSGRINGFQSFDRFVERRLEQVQQSEQLSVKAVMIGHVYADGTDLAPGCEGQITTRLIDRYAERNAIIFTNFGRSQFQLGNQFWRKSLQKVTIFQLALEEIREFFQQDKDIRSLRDMITWFQKNEITAVITMDRAGAIATLKDGQHGVIFARPYDLGERFVDSTGAGDAFGAGLVSYFVDKVVEAEKRGLRLDGHAWDKIITIGNLEDAIERARCWAAHCCTTLGAASDCLTLPEFDDFRKKLGNQASAVVKKGHLHDFEDILWLVDKAY
ncbi:MAG TPA: carbohydrate kinase family protein, partial [Anaerolineae bacterium]|nr:carbohydrate kinase family protein [Anaerolineae bacterium]